jgi:hypothetical protein
MSDVIVHVAVSDDKTETRFFAAVDEYARNRTQISDRDDIDAPDIMIKTVRSGEVVRKTIIFQDRESAAEFLSLWRREQHRN